MAMSLKDKLAAQMATNNQEMKRAKEEIKKPVLTQTPKPETKAAEPKTEKTTVTQTVNKSTVKPETTTVPEKEEIIKKEPKQTSNISFESWTNQTYKELEAIASDDERIYKPITVDVDNWKYIDEMAKSLSSNNPRKITHNEYIELLIKNEVDEFNSLSDKEKDIVQATVNLNKRTNKTKTVGLRANYWNAFDQLCIIHGHCPKCDMINLIIDKDIAKKHPKVAAITKISL